MSLTAPFFETMSRAARARFDQAINSRRPLQYGEKGEAVGVLQAALMAINYKIPAGVTCNFGNQTLSAVKNFQGDHSEEHGPPDGQVGPMTLNILNIVLSDLVAPISKKDDIVIYFEGNLPEQLIDSDTVLDISNMKPEYAARNNLLRFGFRMTNVDGEIAKKGLDEGVKFAKIAKDFGRSGRIYIYGASAGGIMAIRLAQKLTAESFPIRFVAVTGSAFFPQEASVPPKSGSDDDPLFPPRQPITADIMLNWYQRKGNHTTRLNKAVSLAWTSGMAFKEIHGRIQGFDSVTNGGDLTTQVSNQTKGFSPSDLDFHITCNQIALPLIRERIKADLQLGL